MDPLKVHKFQIFPGFWDLFLLRLDIAENGLMGPLNGSRDLIGSAREIESQSKRIKDRRHPCDVGRTALAKLFQKHGIWSEGTFCLRVCDRPR
jgi:hypothetical protein